jgi:hypothetical protein
MVEFEERREILKNYFQNAYKELIPKCMQRINSKKHAKN